MQAIFTEKSLIQISQDLNKDVEVCAETKHSIDVLLTKVCVRIVQDVNLVAQCEGVREMKSKGKKKNEKKEKRDAKQKDL